MLPVMAARLTLFGAIQVIQLKYDSIWKRQFGNQKYANIAPKQYCDEHHCQHRKISRQKCSQLPGTSAFA